MNESKTSLTTLDIGKIKTLGNKERIRILELLINEGPTSWTDLQNKLKLNPNSLNFHITKLLHSDFVLREVIENKSGKPSTQYSISTDGKTQYKLVLGK